MIVSFGDRATEGLFHGRSSARSRRFPPELKRVALMKLDMLNAAHSPLDLRSPPSNHLEMLKGELRGAFSIRVNDRWRLVFRYEGSDAYDVRMVGYH
jgi:proteic killer suppression protein